MKTMIRCSLGILAAIALALAGCGQSGEQQAIGVIGQLGGKIKTDAEDRVVEVDLSHSKVNDAVLGALVFLPHVRTLNLSNTKVTSEGIAPLAGLHDLQTLYLVATEVNDTGLEHLRGLPSLRSGTSRYQIRCSFRPPCKYRSNSALNL